MYPLHSDVAIIEEDGSPSGSRTFVLWNSKPSKESGNLDMPSMRPDAGDAEETATSCSSGAESLLSLPQFADEDLLPSLAKTTSHAHTNPRASNQKRAGAPTKCAEEPRETATGCSDDGEPLLKKSKGAAHKTAATKEAESSNTSANTAIGELERPLKSAILQSALIASALTKQHIRTLMFGRVRKVVELGLKYIKNDLQHTAPHLVSKVKSYRSGYTKEERREIEQALFSGDLLTVTATCALELGVDIGWLHTTMILGFPISVASMWQQAGRSGRGSQDALTVIVLFDSPIDQYYFHHPSFLFQRQCESIMCDPSNPYVLREHLMCAAAEMPLRISQRVLKRFADVFGGQLLEPDIDWNDQLSFKRTRMRLKGLEYEAILDEFEDLFLFGPTALEICKNLLRDHVLLRVPEGLVFTSLTTRPALDITLRSIEDEPVTVHNIDTNQKMDEVETHQAMWEIYEGAIFLHQGSSFLIKELDLLGKIAYAQHVQVDYFTLPQDLSDIDPIHKLLSVKDSTSCWGHAEVIVKIFGYRKIRNKSLETFEVVPLKVHTFEFTTRGWWCNIDPAVKERMVALGLDPAAGLHDAMHILRTCIPMFVLCDPHDVNCEHTSEEQKRTRPFRLVFYDTKSGGVGICYAAFQLAAQIVCMASQIVDECPCLSGCPSCLHDLSCKEHNDRICKHGTKLILESLRSALCDEDGDDQ